MRGKLARVGFNELLDFVRRYHSLSPEPSRLIVSFNPPNASGDSFDHPINSRCLREARIIQVGAALKQNFSTHDLWRLMRQFEP